MRWKIVARKPTKGIATVTVSAENAKPVTARLALDIPPRRLTLKSEYVPEPKPVRGKYEVGVYYFPAGILLADGLPFCPFPNASLFWDGIARATQKLPIGTSNGLLNTASLSSPTTGIGARCPSA